MSAQKRNSELFGQSTPDAPPSNLGMAGIVLCGGKSSRMGRSKSDLVFGDETMLHRVVRLLSQVVNDIVVVAADGQTIPDFDQNLDQCRVTIARDRLEHAGPLAGLCAGLRKLRSLPETHVAAYATSCDVPFLNPGFVQELLNQIENYDVVVPFDTRHLHPLSAVYRVTMVDQIDGLLAQGERRPRTLFDLVRTQRVPTESLEDVDPGLQTLRNLNSPSDYKAALASAGLPIPSWVKQDEKPDEQH